MARFPLKQKSSSLTLVVVLSQFGYQEKRTINFSHQLQRSSLLVNIKSDLRLAIYTGNYSKLNKKRKFIFDYCDVFILRGSYKLELASCLHSRLLSSDTNVSMLLWYFIWQGS